MRNPAILALCLTLALAAKAQDKPTLHRQPETPVTDDKQDDKPEVRPPAKPVILPIAVRDHKGAIVKGLTATDFSLQVGGKDQTITSLTEDNNLPLTLGVLVDVSRTSQDAHPERLEDERKTTKAFLDNFLKPFDPTRPADKGFVMHFSHDIELLQDVTDAKPKLDRAVALLGSESPSFHTASDQGALDSEQRMVHNHGTALFDAVFLAGDEIMSKQQGRKVIVIMTDGIDNGSKDSLTDALDVRTIAVEGFPLGLFPHASYDEMILNLVPGDLVVFFSDGITDAINSRGEDFGTQRLRDLLQHHPTATSSAQGTVDAILEAVTTHQAGAEHFDDETLVALRVR